MDGVASCSVCIFAENVHQRVACPPIQFLGFLVSGSAISASPSRLQIEWCVRAWLLAFPESHRRATVGETQTPVASPRKIQAVDRRGEKPKEIEEACEVGNQIGYVDGAWNGEGWNGSPRRVVSSCFHAMLFRATQTHLRISWAVCWVGCTASWLTSAVLASCSPILKSRFAIFSKFKI
jgi:hypothetical protein